MWKRGSAAAALMTPLLGSCLQTLPEKLLSFSQKIKREKKKQRVLVSPWSFAPPLAPVRLLTHRNLLTAHLLNLVLRLADKRVGAGNVNSCVLAWPPARRRAESEPGCCRAHVLSRARETHATNKATLDHNQLRPCDDGNYFSPSVSISSRISDTLKMDKR